MAKDDKDSKPVEREKKEKGGRQGKIKRKPRKPVPVWKKYDLSAGLKRKGPFCPKCGPGVFMACHKDRFACGRCGYVEKI